MSKSKVLILLLGLLYILNSCKKITKPKLKQHELYISFDFYDETKLKSVNKKRVTISYEMMGEIEAVTYNEDEITDEPILIPEEKEVTILLDKDYENDYTYILDADGKYIDDDDDKYNRSNEYIFKMDKSKKIEITFSKTRIDLFQFEFQTDDNGYVELSKTKNNIRLFQSEFQTNDNGYVELSKTKNNIADTEIITVDTNSSYTMKALNTTFNKYTIKAEAIAKNYTNGFVNWTDKDLITDNPIIINPTQEGKIFKANFTPVEELTFNLTAGEGGSIEIHEINKNDPSDRTIIKTIAEKSSDTQKIPVADFDSYRFEAIAKPNAGSTFDEWSDGKTIINYSTIDITDVYKGKTLEARFTIVVEELAFNFTAGEGGSIEIHKINKNNSSDKTIIKTIAEKSSGTQKILATEFVNYKFEAIAKPNAGSTFNEWSDGTTIIKESTIAISDTYKGKTLEARFTIVVEELAFNFIAGEGGSIEIHKINKKDSSDKTIIKTIAEKSSGTQKILATEFVNYKFEAIAKPNAGSTFNEWSDGTTIIKESTIAISDAYKGKTLQVTFTIAIEELTFNFTAGEGGSIEIHKINKNNVSDKTIIKTIAEKSSGTQKILATEFVNYKFEAIAKPNADATFNEWSDGTTIIKESTIAISDAYKGKTLEARFTIVVEELAFNFTAGEGGSIEIHKINKNNVSDKTIIKTIAEKSSGTQKIPVADFANYRFEAIAKPNADATFNEWSDGTTIIKSSTVIISDTYKGKTLNANFKFTTESYDKNDNWSTSAVEWSKTKGYKEEWSYGDTSISHINSAINNAQVFTKYGLDGSKAVELFTRSNDPLLNASQWNELFKHSLESSPIHIGQSKKYYSFENFLSALKIIGKYAYVIEKDSEGAWAEKCYVVYKGNGTSDAKIRLISEQGDFYIAASSRYVKVIDYAAFGTEGTANDIIRTIAGFLAHASHETSGSWDGASALPFDTTKFPKATFTSDMITGSGVNASINGMLAWSLWFNQETSYNDDSYAADYTDEANAIFPAYLGSAKGRRRGSYHGRGAFQLSWNYNYGLASAIFFGDSRILLKYPENILHGVDVATITENGFNRDNFIPSTTKIEGGTMAFLTSLMFWLTPQGAKPSQQDVMIYNTTDGRYIKNTSGSINTTGATYAKMPENSARGKPGYGWTINLMNGLYEANASWQIGNPNYNSKVRRRVLHYKLYVAALGGKLDSSEMLDTQGYTKYP